MIMARLIDADALHRKVKMETNPYGKPTIDYDSGVKVLEWIEKAPTIDAVEIVRCRDCKYQCKIWHADKRMKEKGYWIYSCKRNSDPFVSHTVNGYDDEYCCYGERKKGENDE